MSAFHTELSRETEWTHVSPLRRLSQSTGLLLAHGAPTTHPRVTTSRIARRHATPEFLLLRHPLGRMRLRRHHERAVEGALSAGLGCILETPTARAHHDVAWRHDLSLLELDVLNAAAVDLLRNAAQRFRTTGTPMIVAGRVGPRGGEAMPSPRAAAAYHGRQIEVFARAGADCIVAGPIADVQEAIGIVNAAGEAGLRTVVSFHPDSAGRLTSGVTLAGAIALIDAHAMPAPLYYAIECIDLDAAICALECAGDSVQRIQSLQVESFTPGDSQTTDVATFLARCNAVIANHPHINVFGCANLALPGTRSIR